MEEADDCKVSFTTRVPTKHPNVMRINELILVRFFLDIKEAEHYSFGLFRLKLVQRQGLLQGLGGQGVLQGLGGLAHVPHLATLGNLPQVSKKK